MLTLRDPIHGFIRADALEAELIGTRSVQRLRWIHQLGLTSLVFPGAEHSRFSHALGAMELAGRAYDALAAKSEGLLPAARDSRERRLVRAAALLHDVGHAPFSHSAEELFEAESEDLALDHEAMSRRLVAEPEIATVLERGGLGAGDVVALLAGGEGTVGRLLAQVVSGELDVDKMDYLLRDSLYCGVRYGNYDLDRLLDTLVPLRDPQTGHWGLGVEEGGVHAVEALVLARYYMFTQVYFNPTGKALELHLNRWLGEEGHRWPAEPRAFLEHDDVSVLAALRRSASPHARAIVARRHWPLAYETGEHLDETARRRFEALLGELGGRFGDDLLVSHSAKDPHRMTESRVLVRHRDGGLEPMEAASHFIRHLARIERFRVYARPDRRDEVVAAIAERWSRPAPGDGGSQAGPA